MVVHRRISFHEGSNKVHSIQSISLKEAKDVWYNSVDFELMRRKDIMLIRKLDLKKPPQQHQAPSCESYRGLESRVPSLSLTTRMAMLEGVEAVIEEQKRQKKLQRRNPELIRRRYKVATAEYAHNAHQRALEDAKVARAIHEEEFSSTCLLPYPQDTSLCGDAPSQVRKLLEEEERHFVVDESAATMFLKSPLSCRKQMSPDSKGKPSFATSLSTLSTLLVVNNRQ